MDSSLDRRRTPLSAIGTRYGSRTVTGYDSRDPKRVRVTLRCDCGHVGGGVLSYLKRGLNQQCLSCSKRQTGHSSHPLYDVWKRMWSRTSNPKDPEFPRYGARGITVSEEWRDFEQFLADMGPRPTDGRWTVERLENDQGYSKDNCEWRTMLDQSNNTRRNRRLTFNGETLTVAQWSRRLGFVGSTLYQRLDSGLDVERALTTRPSVRGQQSGAPRLPGLADSSS